MNQAIEGGCMNLLFWAVLFAFPGFTCTINYIYVFELPPAFIGYCLLYMWLNRVQHKEERYITASYSALKAAVLCLSLVYGLSFLLKLLGILWFINEWVLIIVSLLLFFAEYWAWSGIFEIIGKIENYYKLDLYQNTCFLTYLAIVLLRILKFIYYIFPLPYEGILLTLATLIAIARLMLYLHKGSYDLKL